MTKIGNLGEQFVAHWLETQGWVILDRRWSCVWGEIDLIAQSQSSQVLAFVEVKTRSGGNWDADGRLAITASKKKKLCQTAALFLAEHPDLAELTCRFDVALVRYRQFNSSSKISLSQEFLQQEIYVGKPIFWQGYQLILQDYLESAFDSD